jgi:hypothetical protein
VLLLKLPSKHSLNRTAILPQQEAVQLALGGLSFLLNRCLGASKPTEEEKNDEFSHVADGSTSSGRGCTLRCYNLIEKVFHFAGDGPCSSPGFDRCFRT